MPLALSAGQKLGLLAVAALFIGFALASSFLFPRSRPDFPGRRGVRWFVVLSVALMVSMLTAMAVLAREGEEAEGHEAGAEETEMPEQGAQTTETATEATGDAAAGKAVFASAGCGGCHTLQAAGSSANVGPNLDESKPDYALAVERITQGKGGMPSFSGQLTTEEIQNVAAFVAESAGG